jgi:hypothetical protein
VASATAVFRLCSKISAILLESLSSGTPLATRRQHRPHRSLRYAKLPAPLSDLFVRTFHCRIDQVPHLLSGEAHPDVRDVDVFGYDVPEVNPSARQALLLSFGLTRLVGSSTAGRILRSLLALDRCAERQRAIEGKVPPSVGWKRALARAGVVGLRCGR